MASIEEDHITKQGNSAVIDSIPKYITSNTGDRVEHMRILHGIRSNYLDERDKYVPMAKCRWDPLCDWPVVHRWDGWDSLLISSWRGRADQSDTCPTVDNKRKRSREFLGKCENHGSSTKKDFDVLQGYYHLDRLGKESSRDAMEIVTTCVAFIAYDFTWGIFSDSSVIEPLGDKFNNFYKRLFKGFVKFVLDVLDLEDIMLIDRFNSKRPMLRNEYASLYNRLFYTKEVNSNYIDILAKAVSKLAKGEHLGDVLHLTEQEVGNMLEQHLLFQNNLLLQGGPLGAIKELRFSYAEVDENHKLWTKEVMKDYAPLKEDTKVQLTLELMKDKWYYVMEGLYVEMMRNINLIDFVPLNDDSKVDDALEEIVGRIVEQLHSSFSFKKESLLVSEVGVLFPLMCGIFLPCEIDVIEVVKIANHERRMQYHRFISLRHILCGLSMTEYAEGANKILSSFDEQDRAEFPIYRIYENANESAKKKGYPSLKLENLAEAVFSEACQPHPATGIFYLGLMEVHKLNEGSNNEQDDKGFIENRWSPLITEHVVKIVQERPARELAKLLDEKNPSRLIIPVVRVPL